MMVSRLFFRLLPAQIILVAISAANSMIYGIFAGNFVGGNALSALGLFNPLQMLITAVSMIMISGSQVLCGKFMGKNETENMRTVFSLDVVIIFFAGVILTVGFLVFGLFDLTGFATKDEGLRHAFNQMLIAEAIGVIPSLLGQQFFAFLSLEQQNRRTNIATVASMLVNLAMNFLFVLVLRWETFGLALALAVGNWVFMAILLPYFFRKDSRLRFSFSAVKFTYLKDVLKTGLPGALMPGYQMLRGFIVNALILQHVGPDGLSAVSAANSFLGMVWAVPNGMQVVGRILLSVFAGEEDRRSLTDVMRTVIYKCVPLIIAIDVIVMVLAVPLTHVFLHNDASPALFQMTVDAFRMLPFCMPFSVFALAFVNYGQVSGKNVIVHIETVLDGVICVAGFTALLIAPMGMKGHYLANLLNGVVTVLLFLVYSIVMRRKFPKNMEQLMVIPDSFGVPQEDRLEISIRGIEDVVNTACRVQDFCIGHGVDEKKSYYGALCLEEMAGNVVSHGFLKDNKKHTADVRAVYKDGELTLRIKDDCIAFNPEKRLNLTDPDDPYRNIGIKMVYRIAKDVDYQHILGLNVLTVKV